MRRGRGFSYLRPDGRPLVSPAALGRIRALAVPPAWTEVWINPDPRGHLQATGRDARGRKQSRYHPSWRALRDEAKFGRMLEFGRALPRIRARVARDLARSGSLPRERVVAAVVRLLDRTFVRVGNDEYARQNGSYGLTTLEDGHVAIRGADLALRFVGKGGRRFDLALSDPRLARVVVRCQGLPGERLFQYRDPRSRLRPVGSADVNAYLREASGADFTAKDFRTWAGTVLALRHLGRAPRPASAAEAKRALLAAIDAVAARLSNTRAVCRSSYVHPAVLAAWADGSLGRRLRSDGGPRRGLRREEEAALRFLRRVSAARRPLAKARRAA